MDDLEKKVDIVHKLLQLGVTIASILMLGLSTYRWLQWIQLQPYNDRISKLEESTVKQNEFIEVVTTLKQQIIQQNQINSTINQSLNSLNDKMDRHVERGL